MTSSTNSHMSSKDLSLPTKLLLIIGIPAVLFLMLELICVFFVSTDSTANAISPRELEMPTWMIEEDNSRARASRMLVDARAREWMGMFQSGESFRVHLVPNREFSVYNTFSLLQGDKDTRYRVISNSLGFRGKDPLRVQETKPLTLSIYGDSSSFGWGVNEGETFGELVAAELEKIGQGDEKRAVEVRNFAMPGDSSEYGKLIFERFSREYPSDIVILGFGANDAKSVVTPHELQVEKFRRIPNRFQGTMTSLTALARKSAFYRTLEAFLLGLTKTHNDVPPRPNALAVPPKRYRENLRTMGQQAKAAGAQQVVLLSLCAPQAYRKIARQIANKNDFLFLDGQSLLMSSVHALKQDQLLAPQVKELKNKYKADLSKNNLFYVTSDGCHPNTIGHRLVADQLVQLLRGHLS